MNNGKENVEKTKPVTTGAKVFYGLGAFGYGSVGHTLGSFLMFFGNAVLGIPGTLMGLSIGIGTVWDAVTDPFVGHMSDKTRSKLFGKRHGYILLGSITVALVNFLIWSISPNYGVWSKFILLTVLLLVIETFNTVFSTPYGALGLDLSKTYDDRTVVQSYKTIFQFLSLLVPSLLMALFLSPESYVTMSASARGYQQIAFFTSALCIICGLIVFFGTYKYKEPVNYLQINKKENIKSIIADFFAILKQKNTTLLIAGYAVSLSAGAFITSLGLHVFTYTFGFSTLEIPVIMLSLIGGIIIGQPLWFAVSRKFDKTAALKAALGTVIFGIIIFSVVLSLRNSMSAQVLPLMIFTIFICGLGTGCLYSLPISMFADLIDLNNKKTGSDKTAKAAGFLTFCTKISNAFIMFIVGFVLDLIGFNGNNAVQSVHTQNWLGWLLVVGVSIASVASIWIYSKYSYSKKDFSLEKEINKAA